jgi:transposase-like protein
MRKQEKTMIRYSEAFKDEVLREVNKGTSISDVKKKYGIAGGGTIQSWIRKRGTFGLLTKTIRVESFNEKNKIKELQEQIRRLKESLADAHLDNDLESAFLEIACEKLGIPVEEFKKKVKSKRDKK